MSSDLRLKLAAVTIILSTVYGVIVAKDPKFATAIAMGYVAILLTIFTLVTFWKKP